MESSVKIHLESGHNGCCPGQTIVGKVVCNFHSEKTVRAIRIRFKGRAKTRWTVGGRNKTTYLGEEIYFDAVYNLLGGDSEDICIAAGSYTYPFSYILPPTLPTSFIAIDGNIRYKIKATVDRPWKFDYEDKIDFIVVSPLDLNCLPGVRVPFLETVEGTLDCFCIHSGLISFTVSLPGTGYVSGQSIPIHISIQNMSSTVISNVKYEIKRSDEYISQTPMERNKRIEIGIAKASSGPMGANAEQSWITSLDIPSDKVANLLSCSIINVSYRLKVKVVLPFPYANLEINCPLTLGTVPLAEACNNIPGSFTQASSNSTVRIPLREDTPFLQDVRFEIQGPHSSPTAPPPPSYADIVKS